MNEQMSNSYAYSLNLLDRDIHWSANLDSLHSEPSIQRMCRELASLSTFAARSGLVRYLRATCTGDSGDYLSRYAMAIQAMESWRGSGFKNTSEGGLFSTSPRVPLRERADTLLFLLGNVIKPESAALGSSLWNQAIILSRDLRHSERLLDSAELIKIFLSTAESPSTLVESDGQRECASLLRKISDSKDSGLRKLSAELKQLAYPSNASLGTVTRMPTIYGQSQQSEYRETRFPTASQAMMGSTFGN